MIVSVLYQYERAAVTSPAEMQKKANMIHNQYWSKGNNNTLRLKVSEIKRTRLITNIW